MAKASSPVERVVSTSPARSKEKSRTNRSGIIWGRNMARQRSGSPTWSDGAEPHQAAASPTPGQARGPKAASSSLGSGQTIGASATAPASSPGKRMA